LQIWRTLGFVKTTAPMQLYRQYGGCHAAITALDWSQDGQWVAVVSKDLAARVYSLSALEGYRVPTLSGHKDTPVGVFFAARPAASNVSLAGSSPADLLTVSRDGALFTWEFQASTPTPDVLHQSASAADNGTEGNEAQVDASTQPRKRQRTEVPASKNFAAGDLCLLARGMDDICQMRFLSSYCPSASPWLRGQCPILVLQCQPAGWSDYLPHVVIMEGRPSQLAVWLHEMLAYGALITLHNRLESMTAAEGRWRLKDKHFFNQRGAHLTALDYHKPTNMLVVAFSSGVFDLYQVTS